MGKSTHFIEAIILYSILYSKVGKGAVGYYFLT